MKLGMTCLALEISPSCTF